MKQPDAWTDYWIRQPYGYRKAVNFGGFPPNQPELPIEWETPAKIGEVILEEEIKDESD